MSRTHMTKQQRQREIDANTAAFRAQLPPDARTRKRNAEIIAFFAKHPKGATSAAIMDGLGLYVPRCNAMVVPLKGPLPRRYVLQMPSTPGLFYIGGQH